MCRISARTVLEELDMAQNLAPMIPLSRQICVFNLIIVLGIALYVLKHSLLIKSGLPGRVWLQFSILHNPLPYGLWSTHGSGR